MITKETIIDRIEIDAAGNVSIRLSLMIVEDGTNVLANSYHRMVLEPGADHNAVLAGVNTHLQSMGHGPITAEDAQRVDALRAAEAATIGRKEFAKTVMGVGRK